MQSIMSVIIYMNESKLKDLEQKKSRSASQGKVAFQEISPRSIPMQGIKSVLINGTENELKRKG